MKRSVATGLPAASAWRICAIADNISGSGDTENCTYAHDDLGRLSGVNCGSLRQQTFSFDAFGNLKKSGSLNWQPKYDEQTNQANLPHDGDGNVTQDPAYPYTWNAAGAAASVNGAVPLYDALGRVAGLNNWNGDNVALLDRPGGRRVIGFLLNGEAWNFIPLLPNGSDLLYDGGGLRIEDHTGWLGTVRLATTPAGAGSRGVWGGSAFAPYGAMYGDYGTAGHFPRDQFAGADASVPGGNESLLRFPFRLFQPVMACWLSPDPAGLAAVNPANPQTWNEYAYVGNQPLSATDPLGLITTPQPYGPTALSLCGSPWVCLDPAFWDFTIGNYPPVLQTASGQSGGGTGGGRGHGIVPGNPTGPGCRQALAVTNGGTSESAVATADANWSTISQAAEAHGMPPSILAAIGVRETGFADEAQGHGGPGAGVFQNDSPPNPPVPFTGSLHTDLPGQANAAAAVWQEAYVTLSRQGYGPVAAALGAIRDYNAPWAETPALLNAGLNYLDVGTAHGSYVSDVLALALNCF